VPRFVGSFTSGSLLLQRDSGIGGLSDVRLAHRPIDSPRSVAGRSVKPMATIVMCAREALAGHFSRPAVSRQTDVLIETGAVALVYGAILTLRMACR